MRLLHEVHSCGKPKVAGSRQTTIYDIHKLLRTCMPQGEINLCGGCGINHNFSKIRLEIFDWIVKQRSKAIIGKRCNFLGRSLCGGIILNSRTICYMNVEGERAMAYIMNLIRHEFFTINISLIKLRSFKSNIIFSIPAQSPKVCNGIRWNRENCHHRLAVDLGQIENWPRRDKSSNRAHCKKIIINYNHGDIMRTNLATSESHKNCLNRSNWPPMAICAIAWNFIYLFACKQIDSPAETKSKPRQT